jgi:hypothetical protein
MGRAEQFATPPGNHQGRAANHRGRLDVILDGCRDEPDLIENLLRAIADPIGWPHTTLAKRIGTVLGESCSYETVRKYREREAWKFRDDCPEDLR